MQWVTSPRGRWHGAGRRSNASAMSARDAVDGSPPREQRELRGMNGRRAMGQVVVVGLDIAKSVFQVHGVDADGEVVVRRRLRRSRVLPFFATIERCRIGIEACATGHYWARELRGLGHDVRLMAPSYVKPYVKRQKNDAADAEAICEAVGRPTMRFVPVKTAEQQSVMVLHRTRLLLMRQRVRLSNAIRGHMAEYGIVAPIGREGLQRLIEMIVDRSDERVPRLARACLRLLVTQLQLVNAQALETERQIKASARSTEVGRRLMEIPGVGPVLASAIVASVADPGAFQCGRHLAAWIGLVPRQNSSGGKDRLGGISKQGHRYLRQMLVVGALAVIRYAQRHGTRRPWLVQLLARRTTKVAAVALANKTARIIWAMMTNGERYREPVGQAA
jgi:transposase